MEYKVSPKNWKKLSILTVSKGKNPKTITGYSEKPLQEGDKIYYTTDIFTIIKETERRDAKGFPEGSNNWFKAIATHEKQV